MKKKMIAFILTGFLILGFPLQAWCSEINVLSFGMIEQEMMVRSPDILKNVSAYAESVEAVDRQEESLSKAKDDEAALQEKMDSFLDGALDPELDLYNQAIEDLYKTLLRSSSQVGSTTTQNITKLGYSTQKSNYLIVWSTQDKFLKYNDLLKELADSEAKESQLAYQLRMTELKRSVGLVTDKDVYDAERELIQQKNNIKSLEKQINTMIQEFNALLGQDADTPLIIETVADVSLDTLTVIDVDEDYQEALTKSYDVIIAELDYDYWEIEKTINQFKNSFYNTYDELIDSLDNLESTEKLTEMARKDFERAGKRLNLGLITQTDYINEDYKWKTQLTSLQKAEEQLFEAFQKYEWAKRGLIVN